MKILLLITSLLLFGCTHTSNENADGKYLTNTTINKSDRDNSVSEHFLLVSRQVVADSDDKTRLLATGTIRASKDSVKLPIIKFNLSDINNRDMAVHEFSPEQYLVKKEYLATGIRKDNTFDFSVVFDDPGQDAVNFEIVFLRN